MDFFYLKKLLERFLLQQPRESLIIGSIGLLLLMVAPKKLAGYVLILVSLIWLIVASLPVTGYLLGRFLEEKAGPVLHGRDPSLRRVKYIVVLNNVAEGVRIWNELPNAKLIISRYKCTEQMVHTAQRLGVPIGDILMEQDGRDTEEQAEKLYPFLKTEPFILCTSAVHSPRAVLTFKIRGMNPIPSPSDFMESPHSVISALRPSRDGWRCVNKVVHEYGGLLWLEIGEIGKKLVHQVSAYLG
jgi:uncharacterized SAM-binding protein YcdF (DUF218 family)